MAGTSRQLSSVMEQSDNFQLIDEEKVFEATSPNIGEIARDAFSNLLPTKSKEKYEIAYENFKNYKKQIRTTSSSENILMAYFTELKKKYKPSTLWNTYSMLKKTLNVKEKINIAQYCALTSLLKKEAKGFQSKKVKVFTDAQINTFLQEAPDIQYLAHKV